MIYAVQATLYFKEVKIPNEIKAALLKIWNHTIVVHPGELDQQCSEFSIHRCFHDAAPPSPCELIISKDNCPNNL